MHLTYRPAAAEDIDACLEMLPPEMALSDGCRALLADAWRGWLREGVMQMTLVEDGDRPSADRRVGFGNAVFVTEAFAAEAKTTLAPPVAVQAVRRRQGGQSPVLSLAAQRAANSGPGLTLLVLHIGWMPWLAEEEIRRVKGRLLEALLFFLSGYRLNEVLQEVYSDGERDRGLAAGALIKNNYAAHYATYPEPPPAQRPFLIGGSREETRDGSYLSPLFFYSPPRFFFTIGEQDVLRLALLDYSDEAIALSLHVSPSTVQKRWKAIYERVGDSAPDYFPSESSLGTARTRGAAKRRHLLGYLRSHPEELRPIRSPRRALSKISPGQHEALHGNSVQHGR